MRKMYLSFHTFKPYGNRKESLVFVKPLFSKLFRLYMLPDKLNTPEILDLLYAQGRLRAGIFVFNKADEDMVDDVFLPLAQMGVHAIDLQADEKYSITNN